MMAQLAGLTLGAPGIYPLPRQSLRALTGLRMDVCAFAGVAPRGPARAQVFTQEWAPKPCDSSQTVQRSVPVAVESWDAYVRLYGGYAGPGLLPYAVSAFFQNGGKRAYILRIVHQYWNADGTPDRKADAAGTARGCFETLSASSGRKVWLCARNEGRWGNALTVRLSFVARPLAVGQGDLRADRVRLLQGFDISPGTVLRLDLGNGVKAIRRVSRVSEDWNLADGSRELWAWLDVATAWPAQSAEIVEGRLQVDDGVNPTETLERIGLSSDHPRWLASVLVNESALLYPARNPKLPDSDPLADWLEADLELDASLEPCVSTVFDGGADRYADIVAEDFFDPDWIPGNECPGSGVHALVDLPDLALVAVPDLYSPGNLSQAQPITDPVDGAGAAFAECMALPPPAIQAAPLEDLYGLRLDASQDLDKIVGLQRRLVDLADRLESFIVLLDVPPGLSQRKILQWRSQFKSAYCAGYHPWLDIVPPDGPRQRVNPSAVAAGIIAQRENRFGVAYGPANEIAASVVGVADAVSPDRHNELHQQAVNVFIAERDGVRLTAARTLALDQTWRQLNVRRLVTMIRRVLDRQMQWAVFEPNNRQLRADITVMLEAFLRRLYRANAFAGATEAQAFFVKCDDELNPPALSDQGRLLAQIGIAPAEPLEFIVLDIARTVDSTQTREV